MFFRLFAWRLSTKLFPHSIFSPGWAHKNMRSILQIQIANSLKFAVFVCIFFVLLVAGISISVSGELLKIKTTT
jgi:hypothetical protein